MTEELSPEILRPESSTLSRVLLEAYQDSEMKTDLDSFFYSGICNPSIYINDEELLRANRSFYEAEANVRFGPIAFGYWQSKFAPSSEADPKGIWFPRGLYVPESASVLEKVPIKITLRTALSELKAARLEKLEKIKTEMLQAKRELPLKN